MKTIEAFIREIEGSAALKDELKAIQDKDALAAFLKKHDVSGTVEDFLKVIKAAAEAEGELSDDDAEAAAGGIHAGDVMTEIRKEFVQTNVPRLYVSSLVKRYTDVL